MWLVSIANCFETVTLIQISRARSTGRLLCRHSHVRALHVHCVVIGREFCWASFPGEISSGCGWPPTTDALAQRSGQRTAQECPRSLVKPKCRLMARNRRSAATGFRSAYRRIADTRHRMSRFGLKADMVREDAEGPTMTQLGHSSRTD